MGEIDCKAGSILYQCGVYGPANNVCGEYYED